jgi:diaminohydroxyphosphoribosylaminopyrimidine deaminase/5-amino-6-(5-phosphoribosylamino)uracil reductase
MQMALRLAKRGIGSVEPNPAVGAVIVSQGRVIGRGWHKEFGGPHAEINALEDCRTLDVRTRGATMYVTLEPCCHYGKTPPCTDAIIAAGLAKVVVATIDPSGHANGKGVEQLRRAGIEVLTGICEAQARLLNAPFIKHATTGKCWVILKWAQTIDGKLAYANETNERQWITNELSRKDVHKLRRRVQAILVGINTVIADDPLLTARPSGAKQLIRIVLDSSLKIPLKCRLLSTAKKLPVIIVTGEQDVHANREVVDKITQKGAQILTVPAMQGKCDLKFLLDELSRRGVQQLLVEGGPTVLVSFLKEQLADEIIVYIELKILGLQGGVSLSESLAELTETIGLHYVDIKRFGDDVRLSGLCHIPLKD